MSCTILAIPYALAWVIGAVVVEATKQSIAEQSLRLDTNSAKANDYNAEVIQEENNGEYSSIKEENFEQIQPHCEAQIISEKHFIEKSLETPFMDKNLLIKTLKEHGVRGLSESDYGVITCYTGSYELKFERNSEKKPYYLVIKCLDTDDAESKLTELGNEYTVNVQEESYNNIVAKLKENNMQIENEEIYDDNTIVITVNLE